jgi:hypothetical protein
MIKIKKYNDSGDSVLQVIEFDTIEEYTAYESYGEMSDIGATLTSGEPSTVMQEGGTDSYTSEEMGGVMFLGDEQAISNANKLRNIELLIDECESEFSLIPIGSRTDYAYREIRKHIK